MCHEDETFLSLLRDKTIELNCDLIIGNVDMPASLVWDEDCQITEYGVEKYKEIMSAPYKRLDNGNIEIYCDNYKLGEEFVMAAAGYIGETEYEKIFGTNM